MPVIPHLFPFVFGPIQIEPRITMPLELGRWYIEWDPLAGFPEPKFFMISVNGKLQQTVVGQNFTRVKASTFDTATIEIIQLPFAYYDSGAYLDFLFTLAVVNNKALLKWNQPVGGEDDIEKYVIFWDNGTGTVDLTKAGIFDEVPPQGKTLYRFLTRELASGTYKFVIGSRRANTKTINTTGPERTATVVNYINPATQFRVSNYDGGTKLATLAWTNTAGAQGAQIFYNGGLEAQKFPDWSTPVATLGVGVATFVSPSLAGKPYNVWGIRLTDGTRFELNAGVITVLRLDVADAQITGEPPRPILSVDKTSTGKVELQVFVPTDLTPGLVEPDSIEFYTNDGAGGAVDYSTAIGTVVPKFQQNYFRAKFETLAFGATARIFGAIAFKSGAESRKAREVTITPDPVVPALPQNTSAVAARNEFE